MIRLLENEDLQRMVDYSFGDHSGVLGCVPKAYMKKANEGNEEFAAFMYTAPFEKPVTLFIDNIRLYRRPIEYSDWLHMKPVSAQDREWLDQFEDEDLLKLCGDKYPKMKFIIFTAFEDTPLDDYIWDRIPDNVISINTANGVVFGGKIRPFPHGIERIMRPGYDHHEILKAHIGSPLPYPTEKAKLLLICHREDTGDRGGLRPFFSGKEWATPSPKLEYDEYLTAIQEHKFVLCPSGNGIESARNWETLYMRRVPVMIDHPYMREMYKDLPVLFVNDFKDVTEELLKANDRLFRQAQEMDMSLLDFDYWFNKCTDVKSL